jgi:hypothetical protein
MKRLLALSTALALIGAPAWAQAEDPAVSSDATPALEADETAIDTDADGDLEVVKNGYTDVHDWIDTPAYADGEMIGEIERVHLNASSEVDMLVIETNGVAEIGGREVEIALDQAELVTDENGENSFALNVTKSEFEAMPDFDETLASDYPLSVNPFEEDSVSGEGNLGEDHDLFDDAEDDLDADDDVF